VATGGGGAAAAIAVAAAMAGTAGMAETAAVAAGKQVDLFLDALLVNAPIKDDRALMEFPFFSLQKEPRTRPLVFDDGKGRIEVRPGDRGIATIWDKDVLIYVASIINDRLERGLPVERTLLFSAHNLLQVTGRGSGKRAYELLLDAMFRLRSTTIVTTIEAGEVKERRGFGWIEAFRVVERRTNLMCIREIVCDSLLFGTRPIKADGEARQLAVLCPLFREGNDGT